MTKKRKATLLTTAQVATRIGIAPRTVLQRAKALRIKPAYRSRPRLWHSRDVKRFGPKTGPGQPRKSARRG